MDDDWARDPSVRSMRRIFSKMEETQKKVLDVLSLSRLDPRLRLWRRSALDIFERAWARSAGSGARLDEAQLAGLYAYCFAEVIGKEGLSVPAEILPDDKVLAALVKEAMQ